MDDLVKRRKHEQQTIVTHLRGWLSWFVDDFPQTTMELEPGSECREDLVKDLTVAANRIEELEAALREILTSNDGYASDHITCHGCVEKYKAARKALGEE